MTSNSSTVHSSRFTAATSPSVHTIRGLYLEGDREFADSPLEGDGFELLVPRTAAREPRIFHRVQVEYLSPPDDTRHPCEAWAAALEPLAASGPSPPFRKLPGGTIAPGAEFLEEPPRSRFGEPTLLRHYLRHTFGSHRLPFPSTGHHRVNPA